MNYKSTISYWTHSEVEGGGEDNILTVPCVSVPIVGEIISIDTKTDVEWYDARFKNRLLYNPGVDGFYEVVKIRRYYTSIDIVIDADEAFPYPPGQDLTGKVKVNLPSKQIMENFEVFVKEITYEEAQKNK